MKLVAFDYFTKPFGNDELLLVDSCALDDFQLRHEARRLRGELARSYGLPNIIAADPKMIAVLDLMNSIVQTSRYFFRLAADCLFAMFQFSTSVWAIWRPTANEGFPLREAILKIDGTTSGGSATTARETSCNIINRVSSELYNQLIGDDPRGVTASASVGANCRTVGNQIIGALMRCGDRVAQCREYFVDLRPRCDVPLKPCVLMKRTGRHTRRRALRRANYRSPVRRPRA